MKKNISSMTIALLLFIAVFGITNIPTNYANLGNSAIGWFILLAIYFIPLALIIGELSSHDVESKSGMFGWIELGLGEKWAFLGAWAYFIVNIFYLPMLASRIPVLFSWMATARINSLMQVVKTSGEIPGVISASTNHFLFLFLAFVVFLIALVLGVFFEKFFSSFAKYIGWMSLGITGFFIIGALIAVPMTNSEVANPITISNISPTFNPMALSTFAWIVFAIAGIETVGSYTPHVKDAKRKIPKAIVLGAIMTIVAYVVGFVALSFILTPEQVPVASMENMIPIMFAQLGTYFGFGVLYLRIIALIFLLITITALVLWLNATVISLFEDFPTGIISEKLAQKKIAGKPLFGFIFTAIMVAIFLLISSGADSSNIYYTLYDMTTIAVLLPYVLIALSYISFCRSDKEGKIIKNKKIGFLLGVLILIITLISMFFSIFDLTSSNMNEFTEWAVLTGGGLLFFMLIGVGIYLYKIKPIASCILLLILFIVATVLFNIYFIVLVIGVIIFVLRNILTKKKY